MYYQKKNRKTQQNIHLYLIYHLSFESGIHLCATKE